MKDPLVVDRDLAKIIGLNEAILLQEIKELLYTNGKDIDGKCWVKRTASEFSENDFPFWSKSTIRRAIANCEKKGLLLKGNLSNSKFDKTNWYSVSDDKLDEIMSKALTKETGKR